MAGNSTSCLAKNAIYRLSFVDAQHLDVTVMADPSYPKGTLNHFEISMTEIRPNVYMVTWIEPATGNTVTHVEDFEKNIAYTNITDLASKGFWRLKGEIKPVSGD
ncbi:MoaF-related domain-containing protein [Candidatus Nitrotoga arctica]|nr:MoaF N-terminal domain-containing protein [Candidatus Nitrotoga arctica]